MDLTDDELLGIVSSERRMSIGFDHDAILNAQREMALNYYKGDMPDIPNLDNRSTAISMDIAEAIETILPDLLEIFTGGEDVAAFVPNGPQDEQQAKQETDYVNHVLFNDNPGFLNIYSFIKDACLSKVGCLTWWWDTGDEAEPEQFTGKSLMDVQVAQQDGEVLKLTQCDYLGPDGQPCYDFEFQRKKPAGGVRVGAVAPEDFTVAPDTVHLSKTTYCAMRTRQRAQDLIADGIPRDVVDNLPSYGAQWDEAQVLARDTAGEHADQWPGTGGVGDMRNIETVHHYVRILDGDRLQLWKVHTGGNETVLISKERINRIPFAAASPFMVSHRFYGESIADRLIEIQRIKTALTRMGLDSAYFALNQRVEVSMADTNEYTISDLLRNEPGMPIRSKTGHAIKPVEAGTLPFPTFDALEYFSVQGEQRTGIVRNAQGLNPDSLHDTATGQQALMGAAQKRIRLIARVLAEVGLKDAYLGIHAMILEHPEQQAVVRLSGSWVEVDPTQWGDRNDMTIEVGLGAAGRAQDMMSINSVLQNQELIVKTLGPQNPLVTPMNAYNALTRAAEKSGIKSPELYYTKPEPPQPGAPPPQPAPNPDVMKAQASAQNDQQKLQQEGQLSQAKLAQDRQLSQAKIESEHAIQQQKIAADTKLRKRQMDMETALQREKIAGELQLKREQMQMEMATENREVTLDAAIKLAEARNDMDQTAELPETRIGGEPG